MKILHINCNYMTTALHQSMIECLDKYINNAVYCPLVYGGRTTVKPNQNVKSVECFTQIDRVFYFIKQAKIRKSVQLSYEVSDFDLIHAYTLMTDGNCAMRLSEKYNIPFVVAIRDTDINDFFRYKPYLIPRGIKIMEKASAIFFLSETYKTLMLQKYIPKHKRKLLERKMIVIPNGINSFWFDNRIDKNNYFRKNEEKIRIILVGKLIKRKNIPVVQLAVAELIKRGYKAQLTVVGEAVDKAIYDEVINDKNTIYFEAMDKEKLINIYRKNNIFCMASLYETFGLVYAEAMSQGLPVLYTKGQGFDGQFDDGVVGYAIDCMNPIDIADKIELAVKNKSILSQNCIKLVDKFDWERIVLKYNNIYKKILDNRGKRKI